MSSPARRVEALDGLRGLALIAVLGVHFGVPGIRGGFVGLDIFFVLSGYLITEILLRQQSRGTISYRRFIAARARRILPAHLTLVVVTIPLFLIFWSVHDVLLAALVSVSYVGNYGHTLRGTGVAHTWSLALEVQFYLAYPFAFRLLVARTRKGGSSLAAMAGVVLLVAVLRIVYIGALNSPPSDSYTSPAFRIDCFLAGSAVAFVCTRPVTLRYDKVMTGVATAASLAAVGAWHYLSFSRPTVWLVWYSTAPWLLGALVWLLVTNVGHPITRMLSARYLAALGRISYSVYLVHYPFTVLSVLPPFGTHTHRWALVGLVLTVPFSLLMHYKVERRFWTPSASVSSRTAAARMDQGQPSLAGDD